MEPDEYNLMDQAEGHMWWYRALHGSLLAALEGVEGRILDVGCGTGGFLAALRRARPDVAAVGVEYAEGAARAAIRKSGALIVRGSANALPFQPAQFDAAITADVLCHAAVDPGVALAEIGRVLRPGGLLVVNMPAFRWLHSTHDRRVHNARRVTARELHDWLAEAGFVSVETHYWDGLLLPLMVLHRKILARSDAAPSDVGAFPDWLDASLYGVAEMERRLGIRLPAGGSVLAAAHRPM